MSQKIFSEDGQKLQAFAGDILHQWVLKDSSGKIHFSGTAEELNSHITKMFEEGKYGSRGKKGRRKLNNKQ